MSKVETKRLLVRAYKGMMIVTVPKKAKVTVGPDLPYSGKDRGFIPSPTERTYALRAYDGTALILYLPRIEWMREIGAASVERLETKDQWKVPNETGLKELLDPNHFLPNEGVATIPEAGMI